MGVFAEIYIAKPENGAYSPGSRVNGVIKWAVDEESVFDRITISLKGFGVLMVRDEHRKKNNQSLSTYRTREKYVDVNHVLQQDKGSTYAINSYQNPFSFNFPKCIPPSLDYYSHWVRYRVKCKIFYYIRIKFERPGLMKFDKHFKKEITVTSGVTPTLPLEPTVYGKQKPLFQLFSSKKSIVDIKACLERPVIPTGGRIELNCEIFNDTNVVVKGVETKLMEIYTFTRGHTKINKQYEVNGTDSRTAPIKPGNSQTVPVIINVPTENTSIEHSNIVSRNYVVHVTAILPMPHFNAVLEIPLQIGDIIVESVVESGPTDDGPPPSYWEVMGEWKGDEEANYEDLFEGK